MANGHSAEAIEATIGPTTTMVMTITPRNLKSTSTNGKKQT